MRVRVINKLALAASLFAACAHDPDPRKRTLEQAMRDGFGGWIVIERRSGPPVMGELIDVRRDGLDVLTSTKPPALLFEPMTDIASAEVWAYAPENAIPAWGIIGTLSTASHGWWFVFSAPAWAIVTGVTSYYQSRVPLYRYPASPWFSLARWARFPQGMPPQAVAADLVGGPRSPTSVDALLAAKRYAAEHGIALDPHALQRPVYDPVARRWVFTWAQAPGADVTIYVPETGEITVEIHGLHSD